MSFWGCEKCGVALNTQEVPAVMRAGSLERLCPECGRRMVPISLVEAMDLIREREEAERWRAGDGESEEPSPKGG